jgi:predicted DNA-binding transcriptional regulator
VAEEDILTFVRASLTTTWDLELLLLLFRTREKSWPLSELIRELRASHKTVDAAVRQLGTLGLLRAREDGAFVYAISETVPNETIAELQQLCLLKPFAVMSAILEAQNRPLKDFSNAFKFKE